MGWFDKKSWQLRRKIKDLQGELAVAENEGKYIVEQGLFFAELQEMGEATMMVFGTADHVEASEEGVIRGFFERNGFTIERMRLDKAHKSIVDLEVIPPQELIRHVARTLKESGFKMIDDSEHERPFDGAARIFPLSALIRGISWLFCDQVHYIVINTMLKMNMEGNRLLHWLPMMKDFLTTKVSADVLELMKKPYADGFHQYYAQFGHLAPEGSEEILNTLNHSMEADDPAPEMGESDLRIPLTRSEGEPSPSASGEILGFNTALNQRAVTIESGDESETAVGIALAKIYKSLIGANRDRPVINSEIVLEEIRSFYNATSACILMPDNGDGNHSIHAGAGKSLCVGNAEKDKLSVSNSVVSQSISSKTVAVSHLSGTMNPAESMMFNSIESAAAAPIIIDQKVFGILYVDRRENLLPFNLGEQRSLERFAGVFKEFPDLLITIV